MSVRKRIPPAHIVPGSVVWWEDTTTPAYVWSVEMPWGRDGTATISRYSLADNRWGDGFQVRLTADTMVWSVPVEVMDLYGKPTKQYIPHKWVATDDDSQCMVCGIMESYFDEMTQHRPYTEFSCK